MQLRSTEAQDFDAGATQIFQLILERTRKRLTKIVPCSTILFKNRDIVHGVSQGVVVRMQFEFDSEIRQLEGKIKWSVFYFPYSVSEHFGSKGNIPVCITVDGHSFDHTLLPSKNGHYLVYNEFIKRAVGKNLGDSVHVTLEKDDKNREVVIPAHIENMMKEAGVLELFLKQADYSKREQINHIEISKKEETKLNRINKLIKQLAEQNNPDKAGQL